MNQDNKMIIFSSSNPIDIDGFAAFLDRAELDYQVNIIASSLDQVIHPTPLQADVSEFYIDEADEERGEELTKQYLMEQGSEDEFYKQLSEQELLDILIQRDMYAPDQAEVAKLVLEKRDITINDADIEAQWLARKSILNQPLEANTGWVVIGYIGSIVSGIVGLMIGWNYYFLNKTDLDGVTNYAYKQGIRAHGRNMIILGALFSLVTIYYLFFRNN